MNATLLQPTTTAGIGVIAQLSASVLLREELTFASSIQSTLVPPVSYRDLRVEAYGRTIPREEVGGDLVDLVAGDGDVVAYVADVSGHGFAAGLLMGMLKTAIRCGLLFGQALSALLEGVNRVLPFVKTPEMYATLAGLRYDGSDHVECIMAGHVPLLHYRKSQRDVVRCSMEQLPLGLFHSADYVSSRVRCEPGDLFALFTDGLVETANARDEEFGLERLEYILYELAERPLSEIVDVVLGTVGDYGTQRDDQTLMLVRLVR